MQSYFGGRAECRIRNWEVPVCPVDFMSQYPTVNELLDNWNVITARNVTFADATKEVRQLLSQITLEQCFDRKLWPQFKFFALVRPDNDILPVRTRLQRHNSEHRHQLPHQQGTDLVCRAGHHRIHSVNREDSEHRKSNLRRTARQTAASRRQRLCAAWWTWMQKSTASSSMSLNSGPRTSRTPRFIIG